MTTPTVEAIDRRIAGLRTTLERIVQNLVELDADVTRQMLDASSSLTGQTAAQWHDAQLRLATLWSGQLALADTLEEVTRQRGTKSSSRVRHSAASPTCSMGHRCRCRGPTLRGP